MKPPSFLQLEFGRINKAGKHSVVRAAQPALVAPTAPTMPSGSGVYVPRSNITRHARYRIVTDTRACFCQWLTGTGLCHEPTLYS